MGIWLVGWNMFFQILGMIIPTGWWFGTFFIFHNIWDNPSHLLIFFKMVKTTNQPTDFHIFQRGRYTTNQG